MAAAIALEDTSAEAGATDAGAAVLLPEDSVSNTSTGLSTRPGTGAAAPPSQPGEPFPDIIRSCASTRSAAPADCQSDASSAAGSSGRSDSTAAAVAAVAVATAAVAAALPAAW